MSPQGNESEAEQNLDCFGLDREYGGHVTGGRGRYGAKNAGYFEEPSQSCLFLLLQLL